MRTTSIVVEWIKSCCYQIKDKNRAQTPAAMDSCFGLVRPHQHGTAGGCALGSHMIDINVMENGRVKLKPQACALRRALSNRLSAHACGIKISHLTLFYNILVIMADIQDTKINYTR